MSQAKLIAKNTGFLFLKQVLEKLTSFLLVVIITRYLGDIGFGKYSLAFAFIGIFVALSNLGLTTYLFKEISKDNSITKKILGNVLGLRFAIMVVVSIIAMSIAWVWSRTNEIYLAVLIVVVYEFFVVRPK